jgi:hypothetical protein
MGLRRRHVRAYDNPDHVAIVIHNYRWPIGAIGEPHYDDLERQLAAFPAIAVSAINCA